MLSRRDILAFRFSGLHSRNQRCKFWRTRRACQRVGLGIFIACSLRSSRKKIPAIPRKRAFDIPAFWDAL
jgi:hypothetical protein